MRVCFRSKRDQDAFAVELRESIERVVSRYRDGTAERGRRFELVLGAYPAITKEPT